MKSNTIQGTLNSKIYQALAHMQVLRNGSASYQDRNSRLKPGSEWSISRPAAANSITSCSLLRSSYLSFASTR